MFKADYHSDLLKHGTVIRETMEAQPSVVELVSRMKQCGSKGDAKRAKQLHSDAIECGLGRNIYVASTLVSMYSKCGSVQDAAEVFANMAEKNVVSWTALLSGYVENGECSKALELFDSMDCEPNHVTLVAALKACARLAVDKTMSRDACLQRAVTLHGRARELGLWRHVMVGSALVEVYSKCGDMLYARGVFDGMLYKDVVTWNVLMFGYVENGKSLVAWNVFQTMDCAPNSASFLAAARACTALASSSDEAERQLGAANGLIVHRKAVDSRLDRDVDVGNSLVEMHSKSGNMQCARTVFEGMVRPTAKSWTALMSGYVERGEYALAWDVFESMNCPPSRITLVLALKTCGWLMSNKNLDRDVCLRRVVAIHEQSRELGCDKDLVVASILVDVYSKCGDMLVARCVFDGMPERSFVSWSALIHGYVENDRHESALEMFQSMDCVPNRATFLAALKACARLKVSSDDRLQRVAAIHRRARELGHEDDVLLSNTLLDVYCKYGDMVHAREGFDAMTNRTVVSWNVMLLGYVENGQSTLAVDLFERMDCAPNTLTFAAMLKACAFTGDMRTGTKIHQGACHFGLAEDGVVAASLVDFYGKCGNMAAAELVFNQIHSPDLVSWTALLGGYSLAGDTTQVFSLVRQMLETGLHLDDVTLKMIITCCSHSGMVEEGQKYFDSMAMYGVDPTVEHYTCMVDTLGRANRLHEAFELAKKMPFAAANGAIWMSLLAACRKWRNLEIGIHTFAEIISLNGEQGTCAAAFLLMKSILGES